MMQDIVFYYCDRYEAIVGNVEPKSDSAVYESEKQIGNLIGDRHEIDISLIAEYCKENKIPEKFVSEIYKQGVQALIKNNVLNLSKWKEPNKIEHRNVYCLVKYWDIEHNDDEVEKIFFNPQDKDLMLEEYLKADMIYNLTASDSEEQLELAKIFVPDIEDDWVCIDGEYGYLTGYKLFYYDDNGTEIEYTIN